MNSRARFESEGESGRSIRLMHVAASIISVFKMRSRRIQCLSLSCDLFFDAAM